MEALNQKTESMLTERLVGTHFDGEPWNDEHFEVTMQTVVNIAVANTDMTDFNIHTSIEGHMLLMNVFDGQENTIVDVLFLVTEDENGYTIDSVHVAYKPGAFVAQNEDFEEVDDELPFDEEDHN